MLEPSFVQRRELCDYMCSFCVAISVRFVGSCATETDYLKKTNLLETY